MPDAQRPPSRRGCATPTTSTSSSRSRCSARDSITPSLSVASLFRPYKSLSPLIQFVGRILKDAFSLAASSCGFGADHRRRSGLPSRHHRGASAASHYVPQGAMQLAVADDCRIARSTASTASERVSCSHIRTTVQPAPRRAVLTLLSRSRFRRSFGDQYHSLVAGYRPWSGHTCQKHPSIKTATLRAVNTMSGLTRIPSVGRSKKSLRNRRPRRCKALRRTVSGLVSVRRLACIFRDRPSFSGAG